MRRMLLLASAIMMLFVMAGPVSADPGADVINDFGCNLFSHGVVGLGTLSTNESQSVVTPSGNAQITCHFEFDPADAPDRAVRNSGFACTTHAGFTTNSRSVVTPGGTATLTCMVKA